jgi:predicted nuclease of restriction endonuclease-like (RecB) superfamily
LFYLQQSNERGWSRSVLEEEIRFEAYAKTLNFQNNFIKTIEEKELTEYRLEFRDEYNLSFLELEDVHTERQLENALVNNITKTLGRFGSDFAFMGRQFRLELDNKEYFIDILFYHRKLKRMIAVELKATEFKPEHSQQLNWYLHLLDKTVKYEDDKPSIGILLCKNKSKITVEYALELVNRPVGVATYTYTELPNEIAQFLPNEDELKQLIQDDEDKPNNNLLK